MHALRRGQKANDDTRRGQAVRARRQGPRDAMKPKQGHGDAGCSQKRKLTASSSSEKIVLLGAPRISEHVPVEFLRSRLVVPVAGYCFHKGNTMKQIFPGGGVWPPPPPCAITRRCVADAARNSGNKVCKQSTKRCSSQVSEIPPAKEESNRRAGNVRSARASAQ